MKIKKKSSIGLKTEFTITFSPEDIELRVNSKLSEIASSARIPGFRPGKIPVSVLKNRVGKEVTGEVIQIAIDEASKKAIADEKLRPVMKPSIKIDKYEDGSSLSANLSVETMPDIKPIDLSLLKLKKLVVDVTEKEINESLDRISKQNQQTKKISKDRKCKLGDTVVIDFEGKMNNVPFDGGAGKSHHLLLGSQSFIPGFEEDLIGMKTGDEKKLNLSFPKDYGMEKLAGKKVTFDVKINEIRESIKVKYDDEFAKKLGLKNMQDLKKAISDQISQQHSEASKGKIKLSLLNLLDEKHDFELPEGMIKEEYKSVCSSLNKENNNKDNLDQINEGNEPDIKMTKEQKTDAKNISERRVKLGLLMGEIGRTNNLDVSEEEINQAILKESQKYPGQEKQVLDYFNKNKDAAQQLGAPIFEEKVVDFILEIADVKEQKVTLESLYKEDVDEKPKKKSVNKTKVKKAK